MAAEVVNLKSPRGRAPGLIVAPAILSQKQLLRTFATGPSTQSLLGWGP